MKFLVAAFFLCFFATRTEARVFNINKEKFAGYFLANGGPSLLKQNAFLNEARTTDTYTGTIGTNYGGEFGFLYATPAVSVRFGFEIFKPSTLTGVAAKDGGGADIYSLESAITGFAPKLGIEVNLQSTNTYRAFISAYAGTTSVSYKNDYTVTNFAGVTDHSVEAKGGGSVYGGTLGVESHLTDTTTYIFEFGYRQMKVNNFKYSKAVTTFGGAMASGDPVLDANGTARELDFTGGHVSLGFRFYL